MEQEVLFEQQDFESNKIYGILSYIPFLFLIGLFAAPRSAYARFHANQGLVLTITSIILGVVQRFLSFFLHLVFFDFIAGIISWVVGLAVSGLTLILIVVGIMNALSGAAKELPIIGVIKFIR
ncbi:MAG: hypothetical protein J5972_05755 [Eubacterium sp.]|nr:hypothetical protein [Eubacterium sp.]